jgi:hypothetical protein
MTRMDAKIQLRENHSCLRDSREDIFLGLTRARARRHTKVERVVLNALADRAGLCRLISALLAIGPIRVERIHRFYKPGPDIGFERNCSGRRVACETRRLQPTRLPLQKMFHRVLMDALFRENARDHPPSPRNRGATA